MDKSFLQNIFIPILAVFLSVTTFQVFADGDEDDDQKHRWSPAQVVITKVFSDTDVGELYIHGQEFESRWGSTPIVTLAQTRQTPGFELQVQSFTDNLIVAWLPPAIEAGDYLL